MAPVVLFVFLAPLLLCCSAVEKPVDCSGILRLDPDSPNGVYTIYPSDDRFGVPVYCDMKTERGPWTVIQRRIDGTLNFYRGWDQYVAGFGDADGEYWFGKKEQGLEFMHKITVKQQQELLVEMEDFEGNKASASYSSFFVGAECDGYNLTVSGFSDGGAGDGLTAHSGMKFTTFDNDQDAWTNRNCAMAFVGAFWYRECHPANPNGAYLWGNSNGPYGAGINWSTWRPIAYSLKSISMKIRPAE